MNKKYYMVSFCLLLSSLSSFTGKKCKACRISTVPSKTRQTSIQKPQNHTTVIANAQSNNAKLLAHLKRVKEDIKKELREIQQTEKEMRTKLGDSYQKIENAWKDLFVLEHPAPTELDEIDSLLNIICNETKSLEEAIQQIQLQLLDAALEEDIDAELEKKRNAILIKHFGQADEFFFFDSDNIAVASIGKGRQNLPKLLKKIEAKIKELEA